MFKQLDKAIISKALNISKCIIIVNVRSPEMIVPNIHKVSKDLTSNIKPLNHKSSNAKQNNFLDKRQKTYDYIKKTAVQYGIKSELFDITCLNINFNNTLKGFSSNSTEFEVFLSQLLL
ncbi:MAG: hypothetical protein ACK5YA_00160 [bacterium]|jgi:hypothetical protein